MAQPASQNWTPLGLEHCWDKTKFGPSPHSAELADSVKVSFANEGKNNSWHTTWPSTRTELTSPWSNLWRHHSRIVSTIRTREASSQRTTKDELGNSLIWQWDPHSAEIADSVKVSFPNEGKYNSWHTTWPSTRTNLTSTRSKLWRHHAWIVSTIRTREASSQRIIKDELGKPLSMSTGNWNIMRR